MATTRKLIANTTLGSDTATVTFGSGGTLPQTYTDLLLVASVSLSSNDFGRDVRVYFNGSTASGSSRVLRAHSGNTVQTYTVSYLFLTDNALGQLAGASTFSSAELYIPNYASASVAKSMSSTGVSERNAADGRIDMGAGLWNSTAAITSITIDSPILPANLKSGSSFSLFGIKKA